MTMLKLHNVSKTIGEQVILHPMDLSIQAGEFIVVIGPSGSGKSTFLRLVSGLETPCIGDIWMQDKNMATTPPAKRDIAMVFQDYALYPHMSVFDNMAYGLKMRGQTTIAIKKRVHEVAESLGLMPLLHRKPGGLSGGQKQRVAMGRALVRKPSLFLFDEPLSNLDLNLKSQLRFELKQLHQSTQQTFIYVTHDQAEAMMLATRVLVLNHGRVEQFDTPLALYHRPASLFVGTFMSLYSMNLFEGYLDLSEKTVVLSDGVCLPLPELYQSLGDKEKVIIGIRAEDMRPALPEDVFTIKVKELLVDDMGADLLIHLSLEAGERLLLMRLSRQQRTSESITSVSFDNVTAHIFLASSGERIGGWYDKTNG